MKLFDTLDERRIVTGLSDMSNSSRVVEPCSLLICQNQSGKVKTPVSKWVIRSNFLTFELYCMLRGGLFSFAGSRSVVPSVFAGKRCIETSVLAGGQAYSSFQIQCSSLLLCIFSVTLLRS